MISGLISLIITTTVSQTDLSTQKIADAIPSPTTMLSEVTDTQNLLLTYLGKDLSAYSATSIAFSDKYKDAKTDNYNTMIEEHSAILESGKTLTAKYAKTSFSDVFEAEPSAISEYFHQLKDLETYLKEKI
ncbi:MAG: hypothetical protein LBT19_01875 [Candidatus Nomurabacteria bacterium]|jgi:phenylalanyl-tRNA synthetase beta subunit|nr:hypothetical protein [Candidatus Nomurabacteria bacterium]